MTFENLKEKILEKLEKNKHKAIFLDVNAFRAPIYDMDEIGKNQELIYVDRKGRMHSAFDYARLMDFRIYRDQTDRCINQRIVDLSSLYNSFILRNFKSFPNLMLAQITLDEILHGVESYKRHLPFDPEHPEFENRKTKVKIMQELSNTVLQIPQNRIVDLGVKIGRENYSSLDPRAVGEADQLLFMTAVGYSIRESKAQNIMPVEIWTRDVDFRKMKERYDTGVRFNLPALEIRNPYVDPLFPLKSSTKKSLKCSMYVPKSKEDHMAA